MPEYDTAKAVPDEGGLVCSFDTALDRLDAEIGKLQDKLYSVLEPSYATVAYPGDEPSTPARSRLVRLVSLTDTLSDTTSRIDL